MKRETMQKKIILEAVTMLGHSTTNELIETIKLSYPEISVATVYRNLASLVEDGLIRKLSTSLKEDVYESTILDLHDHFICTDCGSIIDIPAKDSKLDEIDSEGNLINFTTTTYYGVCKSCLSKKAS